MSLRNLPPSIHQAGDMFYRSGGGWMEIFALKPPIASADADEPRELVMPPALPDFDAPSPSRRQAPVAVEAPLVHWVARTGGRVHRNAVRAGDYEQVLKLGPVVGRAFCCGQLLVGRVHAHERMCCVAYEELVFEVMRYEVLVVERGHVEWVACRNGYVPANAIPAGLTLKAEKIYPARVYVHGKLVPGQIIKGERSCRIPYEKHELLFREYEVLTLWGEGDKHRAPTKMMGPTDQEWEEFVQPKNSNQPGTLLLGKRDHTGAPVRRLCLPPLPTSEGETSGSRSALNLSTPPVGAGVAGPSQPRESADDETNEREISPKRFQPIARPRL